MTQENILNFWRDVEVFTLPDFNKDSFPIQGNELLPWKQNMPLRNPEKNKWCFTLLFGNIPKKQTIDAIEALLHITDEQPDWEEKINGNTRLAALLLDENGQPDRKSYVPASFIFGIHCLESNQPLTAVSDLLTAASAEFELRYNIPPLGIDGEDTLGKGEVVTRSHLRNEIAYLQRLTKGWNTTTIEAFVIAKEVPKHSEPDVSFLNSFYLDDLNKLIHEFSKNAGTALKQYLSITVDATKRKDLVAQKDHLFASINPALMLPGRWPSNIAYGLYTAQSGAVNTAVNELKHTGGIRGINGPPGTGKTTLLLDVITDVIVSRATQLLDVKSNRLFGKYNKLQRENGFSGYFNITADLMNDSGIVVASNNNTAVENITKDLPATRKIDKVEFEEADYFSECSARLIEEDTWGILAAPLGNATNRNAFKWNFWVSDEKNNFIGFHDTLWQVYKDEENDQSYRYDQLFEEAKSELKKLLNEFEVFKKAASSFHNQRAKHNGDIEKRIALQKEEQDINTHIENLRADEKNNNNKIADADRLVQLTQTSLNIIQNEKPSFFFFHKLFNTARYKAWKQKNGACLSAFQNEVSKQIRLMEQRDVIAADMEAKKKALALLKTDLTNVNKHIDEYLKAGQHLCTIYGLTQANIFDNNFYHLSAHDLHLSTPYSSAYINKLRSNIFLKSLDVHKYCILANAKKFRNNLNLFFEMLDGRSIVSEDIATTLWSSFFFCVPVISTTLASVSRLFASLNRESIGWLLLDEAGQATPQSTAGIIWRSKRCIIIGDPLQIEPVVTIPAKLVFKLRQQDKVDDVWSPDNTSAQVLADRVSEKGTYMENGEGDDKIWTGFPLRTHRRCEDPMFDIANKIAYSGQMVKATGTDVSIAHIMPSEWFHVAGNSAPVNKHVIQEELILLKQKIHQLRAAGYQGKIFVISPFRSVAATCSAEYRNDDTVSCGTIHTFQGKEAEIVFLVLGSDPTSPGARAWASRKPNMLNVALTRAKKRFYVIGNRTLWAKCAYFDVMAGALQLNQTAPSKK